MNLLQRDIEQLLERARHAGCIEQVQKMIDSAVWSYWGPTLRRKILNFIKSREEEERPIGIIHRKAVVEPREPLIPPGAWER
jgi:hypothetical protein